MRYVFFILTAYLIVCLSTVRSALAIEASDDVCLKGMSEFIAHEECRQSLQFTCKATRGMFLEQNGKYRCVSRESIDACSRQSDGGGYINLKGVCVRHNELDMCMAYENEKIYLKEQNRILREAKAQSWSVTRKVRITKQTFQEVTETPTLGERVIRLVSGDKTKPKSFLRNSGDDVELSLDEGLICQNPNTEHSQSRWVLNPQGLTNTKSIVVSPTTRDPKLNYCQIEIVGPGEDSTVTDSRGPCDRVEILKGGDYMYCEFFKESKGIVGLSPHGERELLKARQTALERAARQCARDHNLTESFILSKFTSSVLIRPYQLRELGGGQR